MKGTYKNLQGETTHILEHDAANAIVYIQTIEGEKKWIAASECKWWQSLDAKPEPVAEVVEAPKPVEVVVVKQVIEEVKVEEPKVIEVTKVSEPIVLKVEEKPKVTKPSKKKI